MATHGVGIIGFGWVAGAHLHSFVKLDGFEPVAILSGRELDPAQIKASHGADVRIYHEMDEFLNDPDVEVVDICTPHFLHAEQTIRASEAGKHVIVEKPVALSYEDSVRMLETVRKNRTLTSVCFEVRFISSARAIKSIIEQGLIGEVYYGEADYYHGIGPSYANQAWEVKREFGGSSLLRAGCHALDMLLHLVDDEVEEVFAYSNTSPNPLYAPYEYPLNTLTVMKFAGGATGKVSSVTDCSQPYTFNMNVVGSEGSVRNDQFCSHKISGMQGWAKLDVELIDSGDVADHPYDEQFAHFARSLDEGTEAQNNLESAFASHRVIFAADRSAELGRPVKLAEFPLP